MIEDSAASTWLLEVAEEQVSSKASTFWSSLEFEVSTEFSTFWFSLVLEVAADVSLESTEFSTFQLSLVLEVSTEDTASTYLEFEVTDVSTSSTPSGVVAELTELDFAPSFFDDCLSDFVESFAATRAEVAED